MMEMLSIYIEQKETDGGPSKLSSECGKWGTSGLVEAVWDGEGQGNNGTLAYTPVCARLLGTNEEEDVVPVLTRGEMGLIQ